MKVRFYGFSLELSGGVTSSEIFEYIKANQFKSQKGEFPRFVYIDETSDDKFYIGVIVTIKTRKQLVTRDPRSKTINREKLRNNETDVNYFLISKTNFSGLYQHYHHSTSLRIFEDTLHEVAAQIRDRKVQAILEQEQLEPQSAAAKKVKQNHRIHFTFNQLVEQKKLIEVLSEFRRIKSYKVTFASLTQDIRDSSPCGEDVVRKTERYVYDKTAKVASVSAAINKHISKHDIRNGVVTVEDDFHEERHIKVIGNLTNFGEMEYEAFIADIDGRKEYDVTGNPIITRLISIADNDSELRFTSRVK